MAFHIYDTSHFLCQVAQDATSVDLLEKCPPITVSSNNIQLLPITTNIH